MRAKKQKNPLLTIRIQMKSRPIFIDLCIRSKNLYNRANYLVRMEMFDTGKDPDTLLKEGERGQISAAGEIQDVAGQVIEANPKAVADFKAGKEPALKFLVGQVMKATRGRANPKLVNEQLKKMLEEG